MKPNVIIINCDDLGYGDIEAYGSEKNQTPYLNKIVAQGMRFTNAYASSSICSPSRAGLLTGCYPARVSVNRVLFPSESCGLSPNEYTMGQMFSAQDYQTMIVGKWHLGDQAEFLPTNFGFDHYYGIPYSNDMGRQVSHKRKFIERPPLPLMKDCTVIQEQPDQSSITERYTEQAISFIRECKEKPFFLYMAHMHVHLPLYANKRFLVESQNGDFGACVAETDWSCGVIWHELERLQLLENTLIIFTSDNGSKANFGASNYPLKGSKFESWEGGFRVPFVAIWKNHIPENTCCDEMIAQMDLLPTLASLIGGTLGSEKIDGLDASKTLLQGEKTRDTFVYFVGRGKEPNLGLTTIDAVRKGDFKLFFNRLNRTSGEVELVKELYCLKDDISESNNVYDANPEKVAELTAIYQQYQQTLGNAQNGITGSEVRPCGMVEEAVPLTCYDPDHPYIVAYYDKEERG